MPFQSMQKLWCLYDKLCSAVFLQLYMLTRISATKLWPYVNRKKFLKIRIIIKFQSLIIAIPTTTTSTTTTTTTTLSTQSPCPICLNGGYCLQQIASICMCPCFYTGITCQICINYSLRKKLFIWGIKI